MTTGETTIGERSPSLARPLLDMIDRPAVTFEAVLARRGAATWIVPLLVVIVCLWPMAVAQAPYSAEMAQQQMRRQLETMPAEQARQASAQMETFTSLPFMVVSGLGAGIVALLLGTLAQTTLLYFGALLIGREMTFGLVFRVSSWSRLPYALSYLAMAGFTAAVGHAVRYPGLSALVSNGNFPEDSRKPLYSLLSGIDLFWLWHLLLVLVGLAVATRCRRSQALPLTLVYAALSLVVLAGPTLLFGGGGGT
jgi:Yip1 domain